MGLWSDTLSLLLLPPMLQGSLPTGSSSPRTSPKCFLRPAVLHELLHLGSLPVGWSHSGTDCSSIGPPQHHKCCQQTLYSSILHNGRGSCQEPAMHRLPDFLRHAPVLVWDPPQAVGGNLLHHRPPLGHPASPWSGPWAAMESQLRCLKYHLPLLLPCLVCRAVSLTYSSLLSLQFAIAQGFFLFLKRHYARGTTTVTDGLGLGQWQAHLGASWTQGKFSAASHRSHPVAALKPKPCHANPIQIQSQRGKRPKSILY